MNLELSSQTRKEKKIKLMRVNTKRKQRPGFKNASLKR